MKIIFTKKALQDFNFFREKNDIRYLKIKALIQDIANNPFLGKGSPKALKGDLKGFWSRRINQQDRLIYGIFQKNITIISCRYHY